MLVIVDKPTWYTSFDLIRKIKKLFPWEKIGHAWTLDPLATGVMIIAIGKDTKKLHELSGVDKTYTTTIDLSLHTDTRDSDARKHSQYLTTTENKEKEKEKEKNKNHENRNEKNDDKATPLPTKELIQVQINKLLKQDHLPLPPFCAKKIKGKKMYEYARAWNPIFVNAPMRVKNCHILTYQRPYLELTIDVTSWTYIRSIAYWLGTQLNTYWALIKLTRTRVWPYYLSDILWNKSNNMIGKIHKKSNSIT
jgi:tRNA pseudouridine55 synthase